MARQGTMVPAGDHPWLDEHAEQEQRQVAAVVPGRRDRDRDDGDRQLFLDAGRVLMLWGWASALAAASAAGQRNEDSPGYSTALHALVGLLLWLIGVSLVALVPVAPAFPRAARLGAAVANTVVHCFRAPAWN